MSYIYREIATDYQNASNQVVRQMAPQQPLIHYSFSYTAPPFNVIGMMDWNDLTVTADVRHDRDAPATYGCLG